VQWAGAQLSEHIDENKPDLDCLVDEKSVFIKNK
jgi:hypothetical protein